MFVIVSVIFMFPGVKAGRPACCDVARKVCIEPLRRFQNYHTVEALQPRHDHTTPPQPEQLEHFQMHSNTEKLKTLLAIWLQFILIKL